MLDPFGRIALPVAFDRRERVRLLRSAAAALLAGELPDRAAALFLAGAISAWLSQGGNLEKDFLKVRAPRGSHFTPKVLAQMDNEIDDG
jgi:hypothetical protein